MTPMGLARPWAPCGVGGVADGDGPREGGAPRRRQQREHPPGPPHGGSGMGDDSWKRGDGALGAKGHHKGAAEGRTDNTMCGDGEKAARVFTVTKVQVQVRYQRGTRSQDFDYSNSPPPASQGVQPLGAGRKGAAGWTSQGWRNIPYLVFCHFVT